jgi:alpha,alpha-trehalose phosphorylase
VWTTLVSGFGGMRDHDGKLSFDPRLPEDWPELAYPLRWHDSQLQVTLTADAMRVEVRSGEPVDFSVRGVKHRASAAEPALVALADQGPVRRGRPTLRQFEDARRDDGTLMSPTVPVTTTTIPVIAAYED